jgi:hypothetical protein
VASYLSKSTITQLTIERINQHYVHSPFATLSVGVNDFSVGQSFRDQLINDPMAGIF